MLTAILIEPLFAASTEDITLRASIVSGAIFVLIGIWKMVLNAMHKREMAELKKFQDGNFDEDEDAPIKTAPKGKLLRKMKPTRALLEFTGTKDKWFDPDYLKQVSKELFKVLRDAWEESDFDSLKGYLTVECFDDYVTEITEKKGRFRPRSFDDLRLMRLEIVHFNAGAKTESNTFTVLVSAQSTVEDDEEDDVKKKEEEEKIDYQQFWTFKRRKRWQMAKFGDIESSDAILEQNLLNPDWFKEFRDKVNKVPEYMEFVVPS